MELKTHLDILLYALKNEGITYNLRAGKVCQFKIGFYVSLKGYERKIPLPSLSEHTISEYIGEHCLTLLRNNHFLGIWIDGPTVYLGISKHVKGYRAAIKLGLLNKQKAIYWINAKTSITL